jgi:hypothetical protein
MRAATRSLIAISVSSLFLLGACRGESGGGNGGPDARPRADAAAGPDASDPNTPDARVDPAAALWDAIDGYETWAPFPGFEGVAAYTGHGATHRRAFVNTTAEADLAGLADGSILVKENLTSDNPDDLAAITVMQKQGDTWFWARFKPDGTYDVAGTTEELNGEGCVSAGCHGDLATSENDYVFLNNQAQTAAAIYGEITVATDLYTAWAGFGVATPEVKADTTGGLHGGAFLRTLINGVAEGNERNLADGSVLVLENLSNEDPAAAGALVTLTVMKKIPDVDPDNDDWFYARLGADGKVQFAGTLGQNNAYCAGGACHGSAVLTSGDFVIGNE